MGCDIHFVVEKKINNKWIGIFGKHPRAGFAGDRDYEFFAEIAAVRGHSSTSKYPKFLPLDISELALYAVTKYGVNGHSHSYMSIEEFSQIALRVNPEKFQKEWEKHEPWEPLFGTPIFLYTDGDKIEDYRIIFWFDN